MRSGDMNESGPNETRIMLWILAQLKERFPDGLWERQNVLVARTKDRVVKAGTKGQADLRGLYQGYYFEFETKKPGEVQTSNQIKRQILIAQAGGFYAVIHNPEEAFAVVRAAIKSYDATK